MMKKRQIRLSEVKEKLLWDWKKKNKSEREHALLLTLVTQKTIMPIRHQNSCINLFLIFNVECFIAQQALKIQH